MLLKGVRIFIVEDKPAYIAITSLYLRHEGAEVESEQLGANIPESLLSHLPIDVILLDLMFPGSVSGFDLFDQIRQVPELAHIPVVAVTAVDPDVAMPLAREKGFAGFISKPISSSIVKHIVDVLAGKQVWEAGSWQRWIEEPFAGPDQNPESQSKTS
jgi:CheY-like chemotaxis protein